MSKPTVFIILFRGVGGATQLPTAPLRAALAQAGFENVATYINSGNAVVRSPWPREKTVATIAKICAAEFGFAKAIYAPTLAEWRAIIAANPFDIAKGAGKFTHAAWLESTPSPENIARLKGVMIASEGFEIINNVAYIHTPEGLSASQLGMKFDKWIGVPNTARNWNTVLKLAELGEKAER